METTTPPSPAAPHAHAHVDEAMAHALAIIQPWIEYVPPQQRRLGFFIVLALAAHLTAFLFISIDTTRAEQRHQIRPHVMVESPAIAGTASQPSDDFWDQMNDPRLFLLPQMPAGEASSANPLVDFATSGSTLSDSELPPSAPPEGFQFVHPVNPPIDQRVFDALNPARQTFTYSENPPAIAANTQWQWDDSLASRQPAGLPDLPSPISDTDLNPTQMRIAVNPGGSVEHVMVEQSSGNAALDQQAVMAAQKIRFHSTDQSGLLWGRMTVFWHYAAKPREEVVPTPPPTP
jgi:TonB family protein